MEQKKLRAKELNIVPFAFYQSCVRLPSFFSNANQRSTHAFVRLFPFEPAVSPSLPIARVKFLPVPQVWRVTIRHAGITAHRGVRDQRRPNIRNICLATAADACSSLHKPICCQRRMNRERSATNRGYRRHEIDRAW